MKKKLSVLLILTMIFAFGLTACGSDDSASEETEVSKDTAILVVSFGTSFNDSREATIGAIEKAIQDKFPQYEVRRAFTSQIIIDKLKERDDLDIDNVTEALDRAAADGIKNLVVQPTHLMDGLEYNDLKDELAKYEDTFDQISLGEPLLTSDDDYDNVITAITDATKDYNNDDTAVVFMGHGTEAESNHIYADLQEKITAAGFDNYYIGTVEAEPSLEDITAAVKKGDYKKVVLEPLMVVAGDHANNDMAGDEEDSWKTTLTNEGYEVECLLQGLGQIPAIQDIYVAHAQAAVDALK
ncbi:sirohydrochlorin cobaltochelatase [bacterium 210820-DFI.6.37]|nr:sirohydrochlorin cobaltochelatase [bacterium 210820-DFI.6.37]